MLSKYNLLTVTLLASLIVAVPTQHSKLNSDNLNNPSAANVELNQNGYGKLAYQFAQSASDSATKLINAGTESLLSWLNKGKNGSDKGMADANSELKTSHGKAKPSSKKAYVVNKAGDTTN